MRSAMRWAVRGTFLAGLALYATFAGVAPLVGDETSGRSTTDLANAPGAPYPKSTVIRGVEFDFSTHRRLAPGSDNWPMTWADDGHQYTAWGDGGGFGGTNSVGRVSLGVARITGGSNDYAGKNMWGGFDPEAPAQFEGKSYGMLCVKGVLYMWVSFEPVHESRLAWSNDHGLTWQRAEWAVTFKDRLCVPTYLNFGRNYSGARDDYVYSYYIHPTWGPEKSGRHFSGLDVHQPGRVYLSRVPSEKILDQKSYEFFAGLDGDGQPVWSADLEKREPLFKDPNGVGWNLSVSYNSGLKRYLLCTEHTETHAGRFGMFDAPEPWGPWTTLLYEDQWGDGKIEITTFFWNFANKWVSDDGTRFTLVFTGKNSNDSWNTVDGRFISAN